MVCTFCGKDTQKWFWYRALPDAYLCTTCFASPDGAVAVQAKRSQIAKILWLTRKENRHLAVEARDSLRGMGVPMNSKRERKRS